MKDIVKQSLFKICSTLVKADHIITAEETAALQQICSDYEINAMDRTASMGLTLGEAFGQIAAQKPKLRREILHHLRKIALSDGSCCREEALLLLAADYCLGSEEGSSHQLVSSPCEELELEDSQVIYLEDHYDEDINRFLCQNHRRIADSLHMGGFSFIYLPRIAQQFQKTDNKLVQSIIQYLAPSLSEQDTNAVQEVIGHLSTSYFKNELLFQKFGVKIHAPEPIFLIKVGNSYKNDKRHADFLCLSIETNILAQLESLIDQFLTYQNSPCITIQKQLDSENTFIYTGFYKTLFDMVTLRKGERNNLIVQPYSHSHILSVNSPENKIEMGPKEAAFYMLLFCESASEAKGISFVQEGKLYLKYLEYLQKRYTTLYRILTGKDNAPDITDWKIRNPILSKIKKAIRENELITEKETFMPQERANDILSVSLESSQIFIWQDKKLIPINEFQPFGL